MSPTPLVVVVMVLCAKCTEGAYVLEGGVSGKWHDSGLSYNKQRYANEISGAPTDYVTNQWISDTFLRLVDANQVLFAVCLL